MILWFTNPLIILHIIIGESHEDVRVLMGATNDGKNSTKIQKQLMDLKEQGGEDISGGAYDSMSTWHGHDGSQSTTATRFSSHMHRQLCTATVRRIMNENSQLLDDIKLQVSIYVESTVLGMKLPTNISGDKHWGSDLH